jgi:hypothetical protein
MISTALAPMIRSNKGDGVDLLRFLMEKGKIDPFYLYI